MGLLSLWNISPELPWNIFASMQEQPIESRARREESTKERWSLDIRISTSFLLCLLLDCRLSFPFVEPVFWLKKNYAKFSVTCNQKSSA